MTEDDWDYEAAKRAIYRRVFSEAAGYPHSTEQLVELIQQLFASRHEWWSPFPPNLRHVPHNWEEERASFQERSDYSGTLDTSMYFWFTINVRATILKSVLSVGNSPGAKCQGKMSKAIRTFISTASKASGGKREGCGGHGGRGKKPKMASLPV